MIYKPDGDGGRSTMKTKNNISFAALFFLLFAFTRAEAQLSYSVTDLGTLGGSMSSANGVAGPGHNAAGMIVGSSTTSDGTEHAFLYVGGQMYDLNTLCDLSLSNFRVLTVAKSISDSCLIIGEGITNKGDKHAFLLTPTPVDGGNWSYVCCQWVWIQEGGGWWWETDCHCYKWHGPPGDHPPCPPQQPHCWWWPLPCPPGCGGAARRRRRRLIIAGAASTDTSSCSRRQKSQPRAVSATVPLKRRRRIASPAGAAWAIA